MGAAYPQEMRDRVLLAYDRGMTTQQIAEAFSVSKSWCRRVNQRRREHGETTPRQQGWATPPKVDGELLAALVAEQPDATIRELRERVVAATGVMCSDTAVDNALRRWSSAR